MGIRQGDVVRFDAKLAEYRKGANKCFVRKKYINTIENI
jgi:hypothetical protein